MIVWPNRKFDVISLSGTIAENRGIGHRPADRLPHITPTEPPTNQGAADAEGAAALVPPCPILPLAGCHSPRRTSARPIQTYGDSVARAASQLAHSRWEPSSARPVRTDPHLGQTLVCSGNSLTRSQFTRSSSSARAEFDRPPSVSKARLVPRHLPGAHEAHAAIVLWGIELATRAHEDLPRLPSRRTQSVGTRQTSCVLRRGPQVPASRPIAAAGALCRLAQLIRFCSPRYPAWHTLPAPASHGLPDC